MSGDPARPSDLERLRRIVARLRDPDGGCPWDREQTLRTLRPYLLEESYEVLEVMDGDDAAAHAEELGDLLFQIVFQSRIREEAGEFGLADAVDSISDKLERRHPHVFGDESAADAGEVAARWEELKKLEGKGGIDDVPKALPALVRAREVQRKAAKVGFDWPDAEGPREKVEEELAELDESRVTGDREAIESEVGDLLFAVVNLARHLDVDPELALKSTTDRFLARFRFLRERLEAAGRKVEETDLETLDRLWDEAKAALEGRVGGRGGGPGGREGG